MGGVTAAVKSTASGTTGAAGRTVSSGTLARQGGPLTSVWALVIYNGDFISNPVTDANYGGTDAMALVVGKSGANVSVEIWAVYKPVTISGTVTVNFAVGTLFDIIVSAVEVDYLSQVSAPSPQTGTGAGATSPITASLTTNAYAAGRKSTLTVGPTENILLGVAGMAKGVSGSTLTISSGTDILVSTDIGTGAARVTGATGWIQGTGAANTLSWTESVNRSWVEALCEITGAAADGMILRPGGVVTPVLF